MSTPQIALDSITSEIKPNDRLASWAYRSPAWKSPALFVLVFALWAAALLWFHPRMWSLVSLGDSVFNRASIVYFILFAELAWLYGIYNVMIVIFATVYRSQGQSDFLGACHAMDLAPCSTPVAVLYTTCNDFDEASAKSCVLLDYPAFTVYILDDSSDPQCRERIDRFARKNGARVTIVRRPDRKGMKAGNLNHALAHVVTEPYFAIVDADEVVPRDFLAKLAPRLEADPACGFVQANHVARSSCQSRLARDMAVGVDIHWRWYQPLRNKYGFVMFLGHGALLRRSAWEHVNGFPEIVSEDLGFAIALREVGYHGFFADDVICSEAFPEDVRAFRVRHVKWTRGTCEFLLGWAGRLLRAKRITLTEKLDILFPTLNLPMTFFFFLFMLNAQYLFLNVLGQIRGLTLELGSTMLVIPVMSLRSEVAPIFTPDFYAITLMTVVAPILCFIVALWTQPVRLFRFLTNSAALYAALSPLSFIGVLGFALTRKARFLVTGDTSGNGESHSGRAGPWAALQRFWSETHPDSWMVRGFELIAGVVFGAMAIVTFQISFLGLAIAFLLQPIMHTIGWTNPLVRLLSVLPFTLILAGILLGGLGVLGLQPVLFGFGFHF
jgi:cellulose synthase/poly-beta-1,6-N-acetylglucosamine synthase-like glycosyltransferase